MTGDQPDFLNHVLWTDESGFTRDGIVNLHNLHIYSDENPCVTRSASFQQRFHVNVRAGILGNTLIGPFIIEDRMRGEDYLNFVADVVMPILDDMPLHSRWHLWYQLDGASAHFTFPVCQWLDHHFPGKWIGRAGPVAWPARSSDLTPLHFFLWGCMKEKVYETEIASREELIAKINRTAMEIWQYVLGNVQQEIRRRAETLVHARGGHFEHLL